MKKNRRGRKRIIKQIVTFTCFSIFSATAWYNVNSKELAYDIMAKNDQIITIEEINSIENQAEIQSNEQIIEVSTEETRVEVTEVKKKAEEKPKVVNEQLQESTGETKSRAARTEVSVEDEPSDLTSRSRDVSGKNAQIVELAKKYIGGKYVWGANGPNAFDCSGLTQYVYAKNGIGLERTAAAQAKQGIKVSKSELQPGDLVFFKKNGVVSHVGIYIGSGKFVHASTPAKGIKVDDLSAKYYTDRYHSARRVIG